MDSSARSIRFNALLLLLPTFLRTCSAIPTVKGCFDASAPLVYQGTSGNQSTANCNDVCIATSNNRLVLGLSNGNECWCGSELPEASAKSNPVFCDTPCSGDSAYICGGGTEYFTVWLTELGTEEGDVPNFTGSSTTTSAASTQSTNTGSTGTANSSPTSSSNNNSPTSSGNSNSRTSTGNNNSPTSTGNNNSPTSTGNNNSPTKSGNNNSPTNSGNNNNSPNTASSASPQGTAGQAAEGAQASSGSNHNDKVVAIAVGVVIGVVALALLGFIFWWVARRRRQTGSFARYRDSVDGSSAALQQNPAKRGPSPDSSGISNYHGPEMAMAGAGVGAGAMAARGNDAYNPSIRVQQPTPGPGSPTDSVYSDSIAAMAAPAAVAAPAAATLAPDRSRDASLRPPLSPQGSRASSTTDPFYTPLEQPSITHLNQTELSSVKAQTPRSSSDWGEGSDELSPLEDIRGPQRQDSRHLPYAYSSEEDFADGNHNSHNGYEQSPMMPGNMPGYFPVGRGRGGSVEMP